MIGELPSGADQLQSKELLPSGVEQSDKPLDHFAASPACAASCLHQAQNKF
jgi:hypothetical protein